MQKIMQNVLGILALLVLALSAGFSPPAEGAVWYITPSGGGEQDGSSWENAFSEGHFSAAILSADVGDELWVALGSYRPSSDDINAAFEMKSAVFSKKEWIIAALAGEGGTISPSGSVIVPYGESITFTISAKAPFTTEDVVVDGTPRGPLSSYTFSNVRENHDIKASFSSSEVPGGGSGCQMVGSPLANLWLLLPLVLLRGRNR